MILLDKFPNLEKLKARIETNFNLKNNGKGFPSVIISANAKQEERNDIRASLYLFMNLEGESECRVDEKNHKINSDYFFLSNKGQPYSLFMEKPVKTFNIHFGDEFIEKLVPSLSTSYENLLENYTFSTSNFSSKTLEFPNKLYQKTPRFLSALHKIQKAYQEKYQNNFFGKKK